MRSQPKKANRIFYSAGESACSGRGQGATAEQWGRYCLGDGSSEEYSAKDAESQFCWGVGWPAEKELCQHCGLQQSDGKTVQSFPRDGRPRTGGHGQNARAGETASGLSPCGQAAGGDPAANADCTAGWQAVADTRGGRRRR